MTLSKALEYTLIPFIPGDTIKLIVSIPLSAIIRPIVARYLYPDDAKEADDLFKLRELAYEMARKGYYIQRYKGLGEMNPDQLSVTTMDPEKRNLLKVSIEDAQAASDAIEELMGDQPESRREFIVKNALTMDKLDI